MSNCSAAAAAGPIGSADRADADEASRRHLVDLLTAAFAIGGYACCIVFLIVGFSSGRWPFPGGDVAVFYGPAGDALRAGGEVYFPGFLYGPPWAVAFAAVSWLGPAAIHGIILALDAVALWTIAWGNWRRLGYILWIPLIPYELAAGQLNLLIAAAIVAAQHGIVWPLAAMTLAKVWPAIALPLRHWRRFLIALAAFALISLPWLYLWPAVDRRPRRHLRSSVRTGRAGAMGRARGGRRAAAHPPPTVGAGPRRGHLQSRPLLGAARGAWWRP